MSDPVNVLGGRPTAAPPSGGSSPPDGLRRVRRIATTAWLLATGVQLAVWLAICVTTLSLDAPWWLWTLVGGALVVGALHVIEARHAGVDTGRQS